MLGLLAIICLTTVLYKLGSGGEATGYGPAAFLGAIGTLLFGGLYGLVLALALAGLLLGTRKEGVTRKLCILGLILLVGLHTVPYLML